ncbi:hypothetical protein SUGI_0761280 [Cryptomeria japonica]|nr:hypothetical protein SUGI_0761280 [Cryptomeria japonica]
MALDFAAWELALEMKRPLKTELYELHTIFEEEDDEEQIENRALLSIDSQNRRQKSQLERVSYIVIFMVSLLLLLSHPLARAMTLILS